MSKESPDLPPPIIIIFLGTKFYNYHLLFSLHIKSKRMYFLKVYTYCIISLVNLDPMDKILFHGRLQLTFH